MFQVLILVCSVGLTPSECQKETAIDILRGPVVASEVMCGLHGEAYLAQTSLAPHSPGEYMKIKCMRSGASDQPLPFAQGTQVNVHLPAGAVSE